MMRDSLSPLDARESQMFVEAESSRWCAEIKTDEMACGIANDVLDQQPADA